MGRSCIDRVCVETAPLNTKSNLDLLCPSPLCLPWLRAALFSDMARLNTHPSATPQPSRSATVDSLYRDPTPVSRRPRGSNNARTSSYPVISPSRSHASDKENDEPRSRDITPQPSDRRKKMAPPRLPTPTSGSGSANKRRRTNNYTADDTEIYLDDDASEVQPIEDADPADPGPAFVTSPDEDEDEATKYYDPQQDPDIRRKVRANIRNHQREMEGK